MDFLRWLWCRLTQHRWLHKEPEYQNQPPPKYRLCVRCRWLEENDG